MEIGVICSQLCRLTLKRVVLGAWGDWGYMFSALSPHPKACSTWRLVFRLPRMAMKVPSLGQKCTAAVTNADDIGRSGAENRIQHPN